MRQSLKQFFVTLFQHFFPLFQYYFFPKCNLVLSALNFQTTSLISLVSLAILVLLHETDWKALRPINLLAVDPFAEISVNFRLNLWKLVRRNLFWWRKIFFSCLDRQQSIFQMFESFILTFVLMILVIFWCCFPYSLHLSLSSYII